VPEIPHARAHVGELVEHVRQADFLGAELDGPVIPDRDHPVVLQGCNASGAVIIGIVSSEVGMAEDEHGDRFLKANVGCDEFLEEVGFAAPVLAHHQQVPCECAVEAEPEGDGRGFPSARDLPDFQSLVAGVKAGEFTAVCGGDGFEVSDASGVFAEFSAGEDFAEGLDRESFVEFLDGVVVRAPAVSEAAGADQADFGVVQVIVGVFDADHAPDGAADPDKIKALYPSGSFCFAVCTGDDVPIVRADGDGDGVGHHGIPPVIQ
jgi:hypothetical protein